MSFWLFASIIVLAPITMMGLTGGSILLWYRLSKLPGWLNKIIAVAFGLLFVWCGPNGIPPEFHQPVPLWYSIWVVIRMPVVLIVFMESSLLGFYNIKESKETIKVQP